jgi:hypothetical protein
MGPYTGRYRGIVVQTDDPQGQGRAKVWCPHLNATLFKNWNDQRDADKFFTKLGKNLDSSITPEILQRLKEQLPWSTVLHPIFGMGSNTIYNSDIDFSEIANDSEASAQHKELNKTLPPTQNSQSLANAVKASQTSSVTQPVASDTTPAIPDYIKNSSLATPVTTKPVTSPTQIKTDNIGGITVEYVDPKFNEINKRNRLFNSSFSITDSTGTTVGNINSSGGSQVNTYSTPNITQVSGTKTGPPITYVVPHGTTVDNKQPVQVTFVPITSGRLKPRLFKTQADLLVYKDGQLVSKEIFTTDSTGATVRKDTYININLEDIKSIVITPGTSDDPVDLESSRLGGLSDLFKEYTTVPSGPTSKPVIPPNTVSEPSYNQGGGGSAMNNLTFSNLLPFQAIKKAIMGGSNPSSITKQTQGTSPDSQTDPKKTKNPNTQIPDKKHVEMRSYSQSEKAKGMLSIPAVGSHVSVYFENGDLLYPIVDGVFYNQEDFKGVHDVQE